MRHKSKGASAYMDAEGKLFKDRVNKKNEAASARELIKAIDAGEDALRLFLLEMIKPEEYSSHGRYREGDHDYCGGLATDTYREKRLCKCMYYRNRELQKPEECGKCAFPLRYRYDIIGAYKIADYEVPAYYYGKGIGRIDLVISDGEMRYATEVKPEKGNSETLLRMIAEIMTYTVGYPAGKYKRAIAFFEGTKQEKEFQNQMPEIRELLQKADITVFCMKKEDGDRYRICRL